MLFLILKILSIIAFGIFIAVGAVSLLVKGFRLFFDWLIS